MGFGVVDLFCGAGGFSYGFERAGFTVLCGLDNDEMALRTFRRNHRSNTWCVDVTTLAEDDVRACFPSVDVVIGSPPCQGVSMANKKRSSADERCKLFFEFVRLVGELKPKIFVMENVPGLLSLDKGAFFGRVLEAFERQGYSLVWKVLNAADFGVPQNRRRVFVVGVRGGINRFKFPEPSNVKVSCGMALSDLPEEKEAGVGMYGFPFYLYDPVNEYQCLMRGDCDCLENHVVTVHCSRVKETIALVKAGERGGLTLPEGLRGKREAAFIRQPCDRPAFTVDTAHRCMFHPWFNRVTTVRENARLQSFPDWFGFCGNKAQQYRQVGNAVPPLLAQRIAECVKKALEVGA